MDYAIVYYNRGIAYEKMGELDEAVFNFRLVLSLSQDSRVRQQANERLEALGVD